MHSMKTLLSFIILFALCTSSNAQNHYDSLLSTRKTEKISGVVPTIYSVGSKQEADNYLSRFKSAIRYYQKTYKIHFMVKLAVLDSTDWVTELFPYGYLNYDGGWAMLPAGMSYNYFLKLYGLEGQKVALDSVLRANNLTDSELIRSVLLVFSLHELGHYFAISLEHVSVPDMFANELFATYFSVHFLHSTRSRELKTTLLFAQFMINHYNPPFRHIQDMDSLYTNMSVQNFKWFHANILLLADKINRKEGNDFIKNYLVLVSGQKHALNTIVVINELDVLTDNLVSPWLCAYNL